MEESSVEESLPESSVEGVEDAPSDETTAVAESVIMLAEASSEADVGRAGSVTPADVAESVMEADPETSDIADVNDAEAESGREDPDTLVEAAAAVAEAGVTDDKRLNASCTLIVVVLLRLAESDESTGGTLVHRRQCVIWTG